MARGRFGPEPVSARSGEYLHFYNVLCVFQKISKSSRSQFSKSWLVVFTATRIPKRGILIGNFQCFRLFDEKRLACQTPFCTGGGAYRAPRDIKRAQSLHFYSVFLSCTKSKKGPRLRLSRGQVGNFLGPQVPRRGTLPAFLQCFLILTRRKPAFLHAFGALRHLQRATRDPKREKKTKFYLHFCRVLVSRVKR